MGLLLEGLNDRELAEQVAAGHDSSILVLIIASSDGADFTLHLCKGQKLTGDVGVHGGRGYLLNEGSWYSRGSRRCWNTSRLMVGANR